MTITLTEPQARLVDEALRFVMHTPGLFGEEGGYFTLRDLATLERAQRKVAGARRVGE